MLSWAHHLLQRVPRRHARGLEQISRGMLRATAIVFRGGKYECTVCGWNVRRFLPYGRFKVRPGAVCPHCGSLERHRLIWQYVKGETNLLSSDELSSTQNVLHVAPEACLREQLQKIPRLNYITADLDSPYAAVRMDVCDIPFRDEFFDVVLCNHVLEHIPHDHLALSEIYRVLRHGGWAILQVPIDSELEVTFEDDSIVDPEQRKIMYGQDDHVRQYGQDYPSRLSKAGFSVSERDFIREFRVRSGEPLGIGSARKALRVHQEKLSRPMSSRFQAVLGDRKAELIHA